MESADYAVKAYADPSTSPGYLDRLESLVDRLSNFNERLASVTVGVTVPYDSSHAPSVEPAATNRLEQLLLNFEAQLATYDRIIGEIKL